MIPRKTTDLIVVHCSASPPKADIGAREIDAMHKLRGFEKIGYHYVIRRNGTLEFGRPQEAIGAHVKGLNDRSVGVCMVGGVDDSDNPENNFTPEQFEALKKICMKLLQDYPGAKIMGHRDLSPDLDRDGVIEKHEWIKVCPSFDAMQWAHDIDLQNILTVEAKNA